MMPKNLVGFVILSLAIIVPFKATASDMDFDSTVAEITKIIECPKPKITPPYYEGDGRLYGCIKGKEETAKVFVNETEESKTVENVKVMWNDWTKGPVHADKKEAEQMLRAILAKFAPTSEKEVLSLFSKKKGKKIELEKMTIEYQFHKGPAIDERLVIFTPK